MKCSACKKSNEEVKSMIAINDKFAICDECVMECVRILIYGDQVLVLNLDKKG